MSHLQVDISNTTCEQTHILNENAQINSVLSQVQERLQLSASIENTLALMGNRIYLVENSLSSIENRVADLSGQLDAMETQAHEAERLFSNLSRHHTQRQKKQSEPHRR